jgi:putative heme-binding domain-containing protein
MQRSICSLAIILVITAATAMNAVAANKPANLAPLIALLGTIDDADFQIDVLAGIHDAVKGRRGVTMPTGWRDVSRKLSRSDSAAVREKALLLSLIFGDKTAAAALRKRVNDSKATKEIRSGALQALVQTRVTGMDTFLRALLDDDVMRAAALRAMASLDDEMTPTVILKRYASFSADEKRDAVSTLAARPAFALALLDAVGSGAIPSRDISAFVARQMMELGDAKIKQQLAQVWGSVRPTGTDRTALIAEFKQRLTPGVLKKGNPAQGRALFQKTCASCHKLFDAGKAIGPELTGSQRRNLDYVLSNLLDPNAVIGRDYRMTVVVTDTGRVVTGIVREENSQTLTLQTANDLVLLPKDEIDVRKRSPVSMMPEGMLQKMKPEEVRDLLKYLASEGQVSLPPN